MQEPPVTEYDKFAYPSAVYGQTHPDRLSVIAMLMGLPAANIERARVLELGCGDGNNIIAMACTLPNSKFYGLDLAGEPIRRGKELVAALDLKNVTLRQMNLLEAPGDLGTFDYIIAHGLYSWVPESVREKILALCHDHLAENGVAYISYNAYPGNHIRDLARRIMQFHVRQFSEPPEQIRQARAFLKFLVEAKSQPGHWQEILRYQYDRVEKYIDAGFFHDDLSAINQPFYFHEFMEAATRQHLQYLGEADFRDMQPIGLTEETMRVVRQMEGLNRIAREQYLDFIEGRTFRQTLLCHKDRQLARDMDPERICNMLVAADATPMNAQANPSVPGMEDFRRGASVIASGQPVLKSALMFLNQAWPRRVPFGELLEKARERAGRNETSSQPTLDSDRRELADFLLRCHAVGFVDLHSYPSTFVAKVSERPMASPLVLWQIRRGPTVSSLRHQAIKIQDTLGVELLRLLDGTRDRAALLEDLGKMIKSGATVIYADGNPITEPKKALEQLAAQLESNLASLAALGLFIA
ncbi:MAG TPA: class I SAM-dependent methyltransferase [Verrucomicrobiae bacterium]|jgi:methyltransferase-like protein|nr:class I SAM-dependent methyltransferase [Verrucomicrobiae bacterium]